ncbi:DUF1861 family protein [Acholeplasma hippikon]|uniref:Protein of uncharacterized function (DUF1861) n=1 Tax=Acholeplasma hippikon TaxID=264636 RepID=A0A449BIY3_9MOLU|nr:DUF1861 family protein [Acholeplasma hippikon]VEU82419.1 Protein of uncharacterised function (DUF1861) [Acholeplasma hippikon]
MKQTITELLKEFKKDKSPTHPKTVKFIGVDGNDVYNPSAPFLYQGKELILGRVEKRDSELSEAVFFEKVGEVYQRRSDLKPLNLQDPCVTVIQGEFIIGGTFVSFKGKNVEWYTKFYRGKDLNHLVPFLDAPMGMKDVRLLELSDHRIAVFSRPQGLKGGRGKIGFDIANSLADVTTEFIDQVPLFDQFIDDEWGGANHLTLIDKHTIGVLGHIANFSEDNVRHYYAMTFKVDIKTKKASPMKIIAVRDNFNPGPSKRPDLVDVLFSAALVKKNDEVYTLFVGVSDAEIQTIEVTNPF